MDVEAIRAELRDVREKISELKKNFNSKKDSKEEFFTKGEQYSQEINKIYDEVKEIEKEHNLDKINEELDAKKSIYDELKAKVEEAEKKFDSVKKTSFKPRDKDNNKKTVSVEKAKSELKQLDLQLQTQVLSLDKEAEITRKIAQLKEDLGQQNNVESSGEGPSDEFKSARKEFSSLRRKFINVEKKIRSLYKQIRLISKEKKSRYKKIDELRNSRKEAFDSFKLEKKEYSTFGKDLRDLFQKEEELLDQLGEDAPRRKKKSGSSQNNVAVERELKKKQKEVEENFLNKGGKLTTEDLLMFQRKK